MRKNQSFYSYNFFAANLLFFLCLFTFFSVNLNSAIINVPADVPTIQAAVNLASPSGDTIQIAAGTYIEQVQVINKSLDFVGAGENSTFIQAPNAATPLTQFFTFGVNFWCVVMIDNQAAPTPQTVNISNLTVDGSNQQDTFTLPPPSSGFYGNSNRFFAIGYHNANGTIQNVHTTNTRQTVLFNQLAGGGIVNASSNGSITFNVTNCLVDFYQRLGIDCRGSTLTANISNSTVNRGFVSPNPAATPNGIQFSGSAIGSITSNLVEGNISTVAAAQATGILPFGAGPNLIVSGNTVNNNDIGIAAINCGNNLTISNNILNFTTTQGVNAVEGIIAQDTDGLTTITSNIMNNLPDVNMELISSTDQSFQLASNQFIGSQTGLIVTGDTTLGPIVTMNGDSFTGTVGYYIQEVAAPNDIWPSTATVFFDGLLSGHMSFAEFNQVLTKIYDKHNDPALGIVLEFIPPSPPTLISISPSFGPAVGGNTVTIIGTNFLSSNTQVFFGSTLGTNIVIVSDTEITVTAPPGTGTVNVTVTTLFGTTPIVPADEFTYTVAPPSNFIGVIIKNKFLNKTYYTLESKWDPSISPNIVLYRIYKNGVLVDAVSVGSPLVFVTPLCSKKEARQFQLVAVTSNNVESTPISIRIVHD